MKMEIYNAFTTAWNSAHAEPIKTKPAPEPSKPEPTVEKPSVPVAVPAPEPSPAVNATEPAAPVDNLIMQIAGVPDIKPNIKSILEKSCIIEHSPENSILYVFNKLQWSILQKAENRGSIEKAFKQVTWATNGLQIVATTREEYLAMKL